MASSVSGRQKVLAEKKQLAEELAMTQKRLADTQEELDAWQRQTMILTQPSTFSSSGA